MSLLAGWICTTLIVSLLFLIEFGALEQSYWLKLFSPIVFLIIGQIVHNFIFMRSQKYKSAKAIKEQDFTNYQLGIALQQQGALDMALDKFLNCTPNKSLLTPLYSLGLEYERKRQYSKALNVYSHMESINADYLDIKKRKQNINQVSKNSNLNVFTTNQHGQDLIQTCLLYTSPSPRDATLSRMPSSA